MRAISPAFPACFAMAALAAGDDSTALQLDYSAPSSCPGEITFRTQVSGRTSHVTFEPTGRRLVVRIVRAGGAFVGRASGAVEKEVRATTCDEVVAALAIVTALAFEPVAEAPSASASPNPNPNPNPNANANANANANPNASSSSSSRSVGVGGSVGIVRDFGVDYGGFVEGRRDGWTIRLGVLRATRSVDAPLGGALDLALTTGRASICPLAFGLLSPCLAGEVGALVGRPQDIPSSTTARRTWAAIDLALRLTLPLGPLFAEIEGYVGAPLTRDRFVVAGPVAEEVFRPAAIRFGATFALGVRSP